MTQQQQHKETSLAGSKYLPVGFHNVRLTEIREYTSLRGQRFVVVNATVISSSSRALKKGDAVTVLYLRSKGRDVNGEWVNYDINDNTSLLSFLAVLGADPDYFESEDVRVHNGQRHEGKTMLAECAIVQSKSGHDFIAARWIA